VNRAIVDLAVGEADRPALLAPGRPPRRRGELAAWVADLADGLAARGARPGVGIGLLGPNGPEVAATFLAVTEVATAAPLNPALRAEELAFELDDLALAGVVVAGLPPDRPHPVEEVARAKRVTVLRVDAGHDDLRGPELARRSDPPTFAPDVVVVLHTSGTTARPKTVPLTTGNLRASTAAVGTSLALDPDDVGLVVMPLFHIHGLVAGLLAPLAAGGAVACPPPFTAADAGRRFAEATPTWLTAVPTIHQSLVDRLAAHPSERPSRPLRLLRSSSSPLPAAVLAAAEDLFGAPLLEAYGMTEAAHQIACNPLGRDQRRPGTVGRAAGPEVAVIGADGQPVAPGELGEVVLRGPNVMSGYLGVAEETAAAAFVDGWLRTGDQGMLDLDGFLTLTGRLKELINRAGEKVSPREVDDVLLTHPAVARAVTFAVPDPRLGEQVAAAVVPAGDSQPTERELRSFVAERLAPFKVPRRVVLLDELPLGPTGKPTRIGLAARLGLADAAGLDGDRAAGPETAPSTGVERFVADLWVEVLGLTVVPSIHEHFLDLGGDSISAAKLLFLLRDRIDLEVALLDLYDRPTIDQQAALVAELLVTADEG
jgi:acyl-CoA synthetase (AMP-forming)/AMP-acid ligase II